MKGLTDREIAELLLVHRTARKAVNESKAMIVRVLVEQFGFDQETALRTHGETFLDGVLSGRGMAPAWRKPSEQVPEAA